MICEDVEISTDTAKTQERKAQGEILVYEIFLLSGGVNPLGKDANPKLEATSSRFLAFSSKLTWARVALLQMR
jgi:hypothetical protein